jgi:hypothetical protein
MWPNGIWVGNEQRYIAVPATFSNGAHKIGSIVKSQLHESTSFGYFQSISEEQTTAPTLNLVTALPYDSLSNPFFSGRPGVVEATGLNMRTAAYGVRVSFMGRLSDTEGSVMYMAPWEPQDDSTNFSALRRDVSFRRKYFSSNRTFTFFWQPTCDDVRFTQDYGDAYAATTFGHGRHFMSLSGLTAGDKLQFEIIHVQEFVGARAIPTNVPRILSPDATHVLNTLVHAHGATGGDPTGAPPLESLVEIVKAIHDPGAENISKVVDRLLKGQPGLRSSLPGFAAAYRNMLSVSG